MVAFTFFGVSIYRYGIFYATTMLAVYFFFAFVAQQKIFVTTPNVQNILEHKREDLLTFGVGGVILGGRLGHILIYDFPYYLSHPLKVFAIHEGGMSFIGGIIGVVLSIGVFCRWQKLSWKELGVLFSVIVTIIPFGTMIGRIGNFLNQELYGRAIEQLTTRPHRIVHMLQQMGLLYTYTHVDNLLRINTNFIASAFEGLLLLIIMQVIFRRGKIRNWTTAIIRLDCYSVVRFFLEYLRQDSQAEFIGLFTKSQWFFVLAIVICNTYLLFLISSKKQPK